MAIKKTFSTEDKARAFDRVAYVLHSYWKDGTGRAYTTRLFDTLIRHNINCGRSLNGGGHREHVVPCGLLIKLSFVMFEQGRSIPEVAQFLEAHLKIADITREEARRMDFDLGLKEKMPDGWKLGDDVMARLVSAGITLVPGQL